MLASNDIILLVIACLKRRIRVRLRRYVPVIPSMEVPTDASQVKDQNLWPAGELDTILHPNTYFKRSFLLKNLGKVQSGDIGVDEPTQISE